MSNLHCPKCPLATTHTCVFVDVAGGRVCVSEQFSAELHKRLSTYLDAIRALEAKVQEAENWNESCEAENRKHILSLREHAQRLEDDRDRLALELFEAKSEIMHWQSYLKWLLKFTSEQHDRHVAEVADLRGQLADADAAMKAASSLLAEDRDAYRDEAEALREALADIGDCSGGLPHYCVNCDRSFSGDAACRAGEGEE